MKRLLFIPLLFCALLGMAQNKVTVTPAQPLDNAVSGHYAAYRYPTVHCSWVEWMHTDH